MPALPYGDLPTATPGSTVGPKAGCMLGEMNESSTLLRHARLRAALTQAELARRAGVSRSAIGGYESGRRVPGSQTLIRLLIVAGFEVQLRPMGQPPLPYTRLHPRVMFHRDQIIRIVERFGGRNPRVFGPYAVGEASPQGALALLVDLPGATVPDRPHFMEQQITKLVGVETKVIAGCMMEAEARVRAEAEAIPL
jgi:transcriptional regulator with XRE-family HTH domain